MLLVVDRSRAAIALEKWQLRLLEKQPYAAQTVRAMASSVTGDLPLVVGSGHCLIGIF